jgi:hypothetical protein
VSKVSYGAHFRRAVVFLTLDKCVLESLLQTEVSSSGPSDNLLMDLVKSQVVVSTWTKKIGGGRRTSEISLSFPRTDGATGLCRAAIRGAWHEKTDSGFSC